MEEYIFIWKNDRHRDSGKYYRYEDDSVGLYTLNYLREMYENSTECCREHKHNFYNFLPKDLSLIFCLHFKVQGSFSSLHIQFYPIVAL